MNQDTAMRVWSWKAAILKSSLPSTTRHLLLTLSCYMDEFGRGCYPTIETLAEVTGLSKRAVIEHIAKAIEGEFLEKSTHGFKGQKWRNNEYVARYPSDQKAGAPDALASSQRGAPPAPALTEGGASDSIKVVQEVHPNTSGNTSIPLSGGSVREENSDGQDVEGSSPPPPPAFFEKDFSVDVPSGVSENTNPAVEEPSPAKRLVHAHHALERQFFGIHPDKQPITELDIALAESWLQQGIPAAFCVKTFTSRMSDRKIRGRGPVLNFRYWKDVIPDQWQKAKAENSALYRSVSAELTPLITPRKEFDPATSTVQCTAPELQDYLLKIEGVITADWQMMCRQKLAEFREHPAWIAVLERMEARLGKPWCDNWLRVCSPVVMTHDMVILWCPSRFVQAEIASQRQWDVHASFQQQLGDHVKLILTT